MSHYYDQKPTVKSEPATYTVWFKEQKFIFHTDSGVFSKSGLDFGTRLMLESYTPRSGKVLDMCAGYGPVGVILNKLYKLDMYMSEINERAYNLCLKNLQTNKAEAQVFLGNLYESLPEMKFTDILVNPPIRAGKQIVFATYSGAFERLEIDGYLYVVIQKKQGAPSSIKYLEELFGNCEIINKESGYFILRCQKR